MCDADSIADLKTEKIQRSELPELLTSSLVPCAVRLVPFVIEPLNPEP